jgi:hypothetical protein
MKTAAQVLAEQLVLSPQASALLDYLQHDLTGYPFDPKVDRPFVEELINDFSHLDLLEEIKILRWYHDDQPFKNQQHPRASLRRWIGRGRRRQRS